MTQDRLLTGIRSEHSHLPGLFPPRGGWRRWGQGLMWSIRTTSLMSEASIMSVDVLLKVYAKRLDGESDMANTRIANKLNGDT